MARTLKELKESRKRKLVEKPHTTIIPHMRVIYDENADDDEEANLSRNLLPNLSLNLLSNQK